MSSNKHEEQQKPQLQVEVRRRKLHLRGLHADGLGAWRYERRAPPAPLGVCRCAGRMLSAAFCTPVSHIRPLVLPVFGKIGRLIQV